MSDDLRISACSGKEALASKRAALTVIDRRRKRAQSRNKKPAARYDLAHLTPYQCRYCNLWHVGHKG